jgi:hypothetical protein
MHSKLRLVSAAVFLIGATALVTTEVVRAQQDKDKKAPPAGMDPAMMQKMMELATPGAEHKKLASLAGSWTDHYKMKMDPASDAWTDAEGTSEWKSVLGGRYMMENVHSTMMGAPFEGLQFFGYDKQANEYVSIWMDSYSTWPMMMRGKEAKDGSIELKGTMTDVMGSRPSRMVIKPSPDHAAIEMYDTAPGKGEVLMMKIDCQKAGGGGSPKK